MNNKGVFVPGGAVVMLVIGSLLCGSAIQETHKNGVLKRNGKVIWCKMQNKNAAYCDSIQP